MVNMSLRVVLLSIAVALASQLSTLWVTELYEYRTMNLDTSVPNNETYKEFDLYFYKLNATNVNLKARLTSKGSQHWISQELFLKYIKTTAPLNSNTSLIMQDWIKVSMPIDLNIYSRDYLRSQLPQANRTSEVALNEAIKNHLDEINKKIIAAVSKLLAREKKRVPGNDELNKLWLNQSNPILEIFMTQKNRQSIGYESAVFKVVPFYSQKAPSLWKSIQMQAHTAQQLQTKITTFGGIVQQNVSYSELLDRIYHQ